MRSFGISIVSSIGAIKAGGWDLIFSLKRTLVARQVFGFFSITSGQDGSDSESGLCITRVPVRLNHINESPPQHLHHHGQGHEGANAAAEIGENHHQQNPGDLVSPKTTGRQDIIRQGF